MDSEIRTMSLDEIMARSEFKELINSHWQEIALNKLLMKLDPDIAQYRAVDKAGRLLILGAFVDERMVGYSVVFLNRHMHYAGLEVAYSDLLFLDPDHRGSSLGLRLIRATEAESANRGARLMLWHCKPDTAMNDLLPRLGYGIQDVVYSREI